MSNTQKANGKPHSLARYRSEAKGEPFVLWLDDDKKIEIARPSGDVLMDVEQATSSREILTLLCGDQADEFFAAVGKEDFAVMKAIGDDIQEHFGLGG